MYIDREFKFLQGMILFVCDCGSYQIYSLTPLKSKIFMHLVVSEVYTHKSFILKINYVASYYPWGVVYL